MKISNHKLTMTLLFVAVFLFLTIFSIAVVNEHVSEKMLKQQIYAQGAALTQAINKTNWKSSGTKTGKLHEYIYGDQSHDSITNEINQILIGTPVLKLKLYDPQGRMRYSSDIDDMRNGDKDDLKVTNKINMIALDVVKTKQPVSSYRFRNEFSDGKTIYKDRYIFSAYLPAFSPSLDIVEGVVEIYYDITGVIKNFNTVRFVSNSIMALSGLLLFLLLAYLIVRNDKISRKKASEREKYLSQIKDKNNSLNEKNKELTLIKERVEKNAAEQFAFMSRMGHELRTPMNAVIGLTDLLLQTSLTNKQRGYIDAIQSSGNVLLDITDEILTIGRLEIGYLEIRNQKFLLRDVIEDVLEVMGNRAYKQGIELFCDCTPEIDKYVTGDPVRLRQLLINLVGNAVKYTKEGSVSIHVKEVKGKPGIQHYRFEVRDTGVGIKQEDFSKIFAAYCHLNYSSKSFSKNTGLGLAISKRLVEAMNGVIGVESEVGVGSVFWFKLPLTTHQEMEDDLPDIRKSTPENAKILVVAQGEALGNSLQTSLKKQFGVEIDLVHTIAEAHQFVEKSFVDIHPYSLFLIDYSVQGECGVKFAKEIRQHAAFDNSYIVMMIPISESLQTGVASGIEKLTCINKPLLPGKLTRLIANLLTKDKKHLKDINALSDYKVSLSGIKRCCDRSISSPRILVVDDNPINREVLVEMLSELNYPANAVHDGHSAINAMLDENYDLILLDCRLPDSDGYDVAAKIRRMKEDGKQPIIIVTSSDNSLHNQQLCFESGVDDFLNKPVTLSDLSNAILAWLPEGRAEESVDMESNRSTVINMFSAPVLDKGVIANLKSKDNDNPEFFQKIIDIFINDTFDRIDALKSLLQQGDYGGIERMAHSIQSGCTHIGAKRMARYCDVLRNMARNQAYAETSRALQYFIEEFDRVLLDLNTELHATSETH